MENSQIDLSNVINVSLLGVPSGLQEPNVNSLALFTNEIPSNVDDFRIYLNSSDVGVDYGTNSETKKMADAIFAQSPNVLTGNGRLVIIPMQSAVKATSGKFETPDIASNLSNFQLIDDGEFNIAIDGATGVDILGMDFTNASSLADVAQIIQKKLQDVIVSVVSNTIVFTSKKVGSTSAIILTAVSGGSGTDITASNYLNVAGGTATAGVNASGETLLEAIARVENQVNFTGIITNLEMEDAVIESTSDSIQATDYIFLHHFLSTADIEPTTGIISIIKDSSNYRTRCLLYTLGLTEANLMKSAYAGGAFSTNFNGSNTTSTRNLKELATIIYDTGINQTIYDKAKTAGADLYVSYGVSAIVSNGANEFFDYVYNNEWFKQSLEVAGFNYLRQTNTKVPQTEEGMNGLKGAYALICEQAKRNRMVAEGLIWGIGDTFGNPEDLKRNITDKGYYIYSLPIAQQSQTERDNRIAPLIQIAIKLAGAIHKSDVIVNVNK